MRLSRLFARPRPGLADPLDLGAETFAADLGPLWDRLHGERPVVRCADGALLLLRHADVTAALSNRALGNAPSRFSPLNARNRGKYPAADLAANILPFQDAPEHLALRPVASRAFHSAFAAMAATLPDRAGAAVAAADWPGDAIPVARRFALDAMRAFTGLPEGPDYKRLTGAFFHLFAPLSDAQVFAGVNATLTEFRQTIAAAMPDAGPDSVLGALRDAGAGPGVSVDLAILFFADGVEHIEAGLANVIAAMDSPGDWLDRLARGDVAPEALVDEGLRLRSPAQLIARVAREASEVAGQPVAEGMPVYLGLAAANRDPAVIAAPGRFDPGRADPPLLVFGRGRHSCIGAGLARALIGALLVAVAARGLRPGLTAAELRYHPRFGHHWPLSYPMG